MADDKKGGLKELSPITIYKNLPKTNCKECGQDNCMAFAAKLVNRELELDACKPLQKPEYAKQYAALKELLKPAVKEVIIGVGEKAKKIGGKLVMYRHELTYKNPTAIAIDVTDEMPESEVVARVQKTENFSFEYIGNTLKLDMIAVRCTSDDADKFKACVKKVSETTKLPMILCAMNPQVMEAGIMAAPKARPLLYAANSSNWKEMAELAIMYDAPLVASSPNDLDGLMSLAKTLQTYGVKDTVLDPGTFPNEGQDTINNSPCYGVQQQKPATNSQAYHCSVYPWLLGQTRAKQQTISSNGANHTSHPCWLSATQTHSSYTETTDGAYCHLQYYARTSTQTHVSQSQLHQVSKSSVHQTRTAQSCSQATSR